MGIYKKVKRCITALLVSAVGVATPQTVFAEDVDVEPNGWYTLIDSSDVATIGGTPAYHFWSEGANLSVGGEVAYCMDPTMNISSHTGYDYAGALGDANPLGFSWSTLKAMNEIAYFGYGYNGQNTTDYRLATQMMIWERIIEDNGGGSITNSVISSGPEGSGEVLNINPEKSQIQANIDAYHEAGNISFRIYHQNGSEITDGKAYIGEVVKVSVASGTLSNFNLYDGQMAPFQFVTSDGTPISASQVDKSANEFYIKASAQGTGTIRLRSTYESRAIDVQNFVYICDGSQTVFTVGALWDPTRANIELEAYGVNLKIRKLDADTKTTNPQGNASLIGAEFTLKNLTDGTEVGTFIIGDDCTSNVLEGLPPDFEYELTETKAPEGYKVIAEPITFTNLLDLEGDPSLKIKDIEEDVITGKFSVKKIITDSHASGFVVPEEGAEFTAVLKSYVDEVGDYDTAVENVKAGTSGLTDKEYAIITTDANGEATSGDLAYGTYMIKQTGGDKELAMMHPDFEFKVSEDGQETVNYTISNISKEYYVRVVKKDADSGKQVIMTPAQFKIKDSEGNYVTQKVGSVTYDTFVTTAKEVGDIPAGAFYVDTEEEGTTVTPLTLMPGDYTLEEVDVPDGYVFPEEELAFTLASEQVVEGEDPEEDFQTVELTCENTQAKGKLELTKTVIQYDADKTLVDKKDLSGIGFTLYAKEDIIDPADGEVLYAAGSVYGEYNVDKDGNLTVEDIPMGKYYLKETTVPAGYIKDEAEYPVEFIQTDKTTKVYPVALKLENYTTRYEFTKKDIGGEEVEGAVITITDENGEVVDTWTSTTEPHKIEGLEVGKTYKFKEEQAPEGYYYVVETEFTVVSETEIQKVEIIDKKIQYQIVKVDDKDGSYVPGVTLKLTDTTTGDEVGTWKTGTEPIDVSELLVADHDYELEESEYVAGVYKATTITFHVDKYNPASDEMITITMVDVTTSVAVFKTDDTGKPLAGAEMQLFEAEKSEDGTYTIKDESAPIYEWISKTEPEDISKYVKGDEHYVVRESEAPFGFDVTKDIGFTVTGKQETHQVIMVTDQRKAFYVAVTKVDAADESKKLKDAEITLFNADGTVAKDINGKECVGVTDGQGNIVFRVKYSEAGYYVQETAAPQGYRINKKHYDVVLAETYDFADNNPIKIVVNDEAAPATGASVPFVAGGIGFLALAMAFVLNKKRVLSK